jgi:hypothetical protein
MRRARILTSLAALGVAATFTVAPAAGAQAQRTDTPLGQCAPIVNHIEIDAATGVGFVEWTVPLEFTAPDGTTVGCNASEWEVYFEDLRGNDGVDLPADHRRPIGTAKGIVVAPGETRTQTMPSIAPMCGGQLDLVQAGDTQPYAAAVWEVQGGCGSLPLGRVACTGTDQPRFDFTLPGQSGILHVRFGSPSGETVMDVAESGPGVWAVIPAVGPADQQLSVIDATVTDDHGVQHQAQLVDSSCYTPDLPPAGDSPPPPPTADVPPAPPAGEGTPAAGGQETVPSIAVLPASATLIDTPDRAALPMTGGPDVGLLSIVGAGLLACGGALLARGRRMAGRTGR